MSDKAANKDNLRLWVSELREGGHKQGKNTLCRILDDDSTEHCCLDVAHLAAIKAGIELTREVHTNDQGSRFVKTDEEFSFLAPVVRAWLGLDSNDPLLDRFDTATALNDDLEKTFEDIADAIERTYEL